MSYDPDHKVSCCYEGCYATINLTPNEQKEIDALSGDLRRLRYDYGTVHEHRELLIALTRRCPLCAATPGRHVRIFREKWRFADVGDVTRAHPTRGGDQMTTTPTLIPERIEKLRGIVPGTGAHDPPPNGTPIGCEVELLSWAAGMPWSDSTPCISKVLAAFLRRWNDDLDEEGRAKLHAHCLDRIEAITATGSDGHDEARAWMATDWLVRVQAPAWLELAGVEESPAALRALPPITTETVTAAQPEINQARRRGAAARAAATDAATDAAWAAARDAARAAATAAATAAARAAATDAATDAARAAATESLTPTKTALQSSAHELLNRMIDAGKDRP